METTNQDEEKLSADQERIRNMTNEEYLAWDKAFWAEEARRKKEEFDKRQAEAEKKLADLRASIPPMDIWVFRYVGDGKLLEMYGDFFTMADGQVLEKRGFTRFRTREFVLPDGTKVARDVTMGWYPLKTRGIKLPIVFAEDGDVELFGAVTDWDDPKLFKDKKDEG